MSGLATALRAELFVATRSRGVHFVVLLPALVVFGQLLLQKASGLTQAAMQNPGSAEFDANNAYGYLVDGLSTGLVLLVLSMLAFSAWSFAHDRDTGVVRHVLIRRASRLTLLCARFCYVHVLAFISLLLLFVVAWASCHLFWEFGPVVEDGFELIGVAEIHTEIRQGLMLALLPLPATLGLGVLISVAAQSATQAVVTALGLLLGFDILKGSFGSAAHYVFTYYQPSLVDQSYLGEVARLVRGYSDVLIDERLHTLNIWVPWPALLLFGCLAALLVRRKKL